MLPVIFHPRCVNCHGAVNPYVDPQIGRHLGGQMTDSITGEPLPDSSCQDCHGELPGWQVPGQAMLFVGKNPKELCVQFKQFAPGGGSQFVEHVEHEPGLPQFIKTAFLGTRALNTLGEVVYEDQMGVPPVPEKPPLDHGALVGLAKDWVNAIGSGWAEAPDCGCATSGAWYGTVTARGVFQNAGMSGTLQVGSGATVMLEAVDGPSWSSGRRVRNYRATGGVVRWAAIATGACRGTISGTMPLDTLDIDGNPMAELRMEDIGRSEVGYQPTTGSWPDRWSPIFHVQCDMDGTRVPVPMTNLLPTWWHYDLSSPPTTTDLDRLKGRYEWAPGQGVSVVWEWDLKRQP